MIAFISDIHANRPALQAVFDDIDRLGTVERIYCLGDVIGYGPDVEWCIDAVTSRCKLFLMGNHEHAVLHGAFGFHAGAKRAIDWTRRQIEALDPAAKRKAVQDLLKSLPIRHAIEDVLLVHGSPRDPVMEYVLESDLWEGADPSKIDEIFDAIPRLCFVGHTHRPGVFTADRCFLAAGELPDGYDVSDGKYLINVGSVGQPRDRDPRACYTLFSGDAVYFRRVTYDIDAVSARVRAVPELDPRFADRLYRGE
ncbi:MAG: metallophosphoesterase family protein [Planctomycetes bacterium]|nr:metallophosphoesterase family protein [Planctomycetota bacterium]